VKGLLPDEEKEKIGPKNVATSKGTKTSAIITAKPQANPNPVPVKPPAPQTTILQVPPQPPMLAPQPPIMMMPAPPIPPMRPPPLMMAAPPPMAGFVTPVAPQMANTVNMAVKHGSEGPLEDEPSNKKLRNEDSLIPEAVFLARNAV
ncbi:hypothetical protein AMK59_471, partial [Oryctes borbonicus]